MLKKLFTKAPVIAVLSAAIIFVIVASAGIGLEWPLLVAVATSIFAIAEGWCLWGLWRKGIQVDRHMRQIRFIADRFQSMIRMLPGGYCLFTPQGLLREENGLAARLGVAKVSHMDDLIASVKEGPELMEAFRKLQISGVSFELAIHRAQDGESRRIVGRRFRIGQDGPHVDLLWVPDPFGVASPAPLSVTQDKKKPPVAASKAEAIASETAKEILEPTTETTAVPAKTVPALADGIAPPELCCEKLAIPVWGRNAEMQIVMCNGAYAAALEMSAQDVLKKQAELLSPTTKGGNGPVLAQKSRTENKAQKQRNHVVVAGQRRFLEITEVPLPLAPKKEGEKTDEKALAFLGYAIDVTAEEEKDNELKRHLAAHHEVLEHLGTAISVFGPDQHLEFYNRAYQRLWNAPESFLDGKPSFGDVLEHLRANCCIPEQASFSKYKKNRTGLFTSLLEPREDVMFLPDGRSLRILAAPHPLGGLIFVHENVTDQLALETSYNTLMAVQHETIDHLAEGVALFGPDGKLRLSNQALARLWKYEPAFLTSSPHVTDMLEIARPLLEIDEDWASRKAKMVSYALDRTPRSGRMKRADDLVVEYLTVPLPDGSVLNSFVDITDSVHVEQALRASNAALAAADRLKSDFVANVSYQLRTPLNTITGFAEILAEQYFGTLNERQLEYTTTIRTESEKLSRLINDVLDLATIEAGRLFLDRRAVSVAQLLNDAKEMTSEWARQQSLDILIDCPSDLGTFEVDENRMKQALFNLIGNAIKYTPSGGKIGLAAWKQDIWIVISVLDTGVGIPQDDQERVFGKFEKSNAHLRQGGAGLGLSLVKSFVELHGGRVEILSDEKDGTRISCFLPQKPLEEKETGGLLGTDS